MTKAQIKQFQVLGQKYIQEFAARIQVQNVVKLMDYFHERDFAAEIAQGFADPKNAAHKAAAIRDGYDPATLNARIQTLYATIQQEYTDLIGQKGTENYTPPDPANPTSEQDLYQEYKLVQAMYANKQDIYENEQLVLAKELEANAITDPNDRAKKQTEVADIRQKLSDSQNVYVLQCEQLKKSDRVNVLRRAIKNAVENALPPKFCWKIQSAEKQCNNPDFEYHFVSCKLKCGPGYERFGFHCRKACSENDLLQQKCKYTWLKSRISYKVANTQNWGASEFRWLSSASKSYNPVKSADGDNKYTLSCPAETTPDTGIWSSTCKPNLNYECRHIGYQTCAVKGCAISETDCTNFKTDLALQTAIAALKIATMFVAPGTGVVLNWIVLGVGWANSVKDMFKKIYDQQTQFLNVYNNDILRNNLVDKIKTYMQEQEWAMEIINRDIQRPSGANVETKLNNFIRMTLAYQVKAIEKRRSKGKVRGDIPDRTELLDQKDWNDVAVDAAKLVLSIANNVPATINDEQIKAVLGEGLIVTTVGGETTSSIGLANLLNVDTFLSIYDVTQNCVTSVSNAGCGGAVMGLASAFDPTGITNIVKVFMQPFCDVGVALNDARQLIRNQRDVEVRGTMFKIGNLWNRITNTGNHERIFVKKNGLDEIRYYDGLIEKGVIDLTKVLEVQIFENAKPNEHKVIIKSNKGVQRDNLELWIQKAAETGNWLTWFKAFKTRVAAGKQH